jgi:hypothetical protein
VSPPRFIEIEGRRYLWRDILTLRREQRRQSAPAQPTLFEVKDDARPPSQRSAAGRFAEPTLFDGDAR